MNRYDVVVVGARVAGAATALLAARAGLEVLMVDRGRYGSDTLSTHALMRGGVVQLHRRGLLDQVAATTPAIRRTTLHFPDGDVAVTIKPSHGIDALYAPRRLLLDRILVDAAREAGVTVRHGITVTGLHRDLSGRVTGVEGHDRVGAAFLASGRLVVGADGLRSVVAGLVAAPVEHSGRSAGAVVYGYWSGLDSTGYEWAFRNRAAAGFIPTNEGLTCVFAGGPASRPGARARSVMEATLRAADPDMAERLAAAHPPRNTPRFTGPAGFLRRSWGPGWALVGDAGSWRDPISAHGITDALRDAELLAAALTASGADETEALRGYQSRRDQAALPLLQAADRIASYDWDDEEIADRHRRLSAAMTADLDVIAFLDQNTQPA